MLGSGATPGVMVLTVEELFRRIQERENEMTCEIAVSYIEVNYLKWRLNIGWKTSHPSFLPFEHSCDFFLDYHHKFLFLYIYF